MRRNYPLESFLKAVPDLKSINPYLVYKLAARLNVDYYRFREVLHIYRNYDEYFNTPFTEVEGDII